MEAQIPSRFKTQRERGAELTAGVNRDKQVACTDRKRGGNRKAKKNSSCCGWKGSLRTQIVGGEMEASPGSHPTCATHALSFSSAVCVCVCVFRCRVCIVEVATPDQNLAPFLRQEVQPLAQHLPSSLCCFLRRLVSQRRASASRMVFPPPSSRQQ